MWLMWNGEQLPLNLRVVVPQVVLLVFMSVVPLLNVLEVEHDLALKLTLLAQLGGAVCVTVYQSASYGAGALLGPSYTNKLETGKGVGGLVRFFLVEEGVTGREFSDETQRRNDVCCC